MSNVLKRMQKHFVDLFVLFRVTKFGIFPINDMQTSPLRSGHIYIKYATVLKQMKN